MTEPWIIPFLDARAAETGAAENTLLAYARDLEDFAAWLRRTGGTFQTASRAQIEAYLIACAAEGLATSTRARRLSAIRHLFAFAFEEGLRTYTPALTIKAPGQARKTASTASNDPAGGTLLARPGPMPVLSGWSIANPSTQHTATHGWPAD